MLQEQFLKAVTPEADEQIIPFKGQHSSKQYIPKKKNEAMGI